MAKVTAAQWLDKWGRRLNAAGADIQSGVKGVSTAPGVKAAAQSQLWVQRLQESVDVWAKNVSAVSLSDWQDAMLNKGVGRIAAGVTQAQASKSAQITALLNAVDNAVASTNAMPRGSLEQNIQRAVTFMQQMSANAPKRRG